jgi:DNA repair protein RadD
MLLRERQKVFVDRASAALDERRNTVGIAPTGAGKTVMASATIARQIQGGGSALFIQHRDELVEQNYQTFRRVAPRIPTDFVTADRKRWERKGVTFSMIQTLAREANLEQMPPVDLVAVDEAHHIVSDSYLKVIDRAKRLNPQVKIFGVTATPTRGDSRTLRTVFDNVGDQITLAELIREGYLVPPRAVVIDTGTREDLKQVRKLTTDFDMAAVEQIMNKRVVNDRVVQEWKERAADRRTVVFTSTVQHGVDVTEAFNRAGVNAVMVTGDMPDASRKAALDLFDAGEIQVVVNVAVLTEGWDCQPVSCVVLLRPCSYKGTMIQMIGRGLRKVDPERYPGIVKNDCLVMDFGYSIHIHRGIEQMVDVERQEGSKQCPQCSAHVPACVKTCAICGYEFEEADPGEDAPPPENNETPTKGVLEDFVMTEVDLIEMSPFRWEALFDGVVMVANAINAWTMVIFYQGAWHALGAAEQTGVRRLAVSDSKIMALQSADEFLRAHGDEDTAQKSKRWLSSPPTEKQLQHLGLSPMAAIGINRYRASCMLQWRFSERIIRQRLMEGQKSVRGHDYAHAA